MAQALSHPALVFSHSPLLSLTAVPQVGHLKVKCRLAAAGGGNAGGGGGGACFTCGGYGHRAAQCPQAEGGSGGGGFGKAGRECYECGQMGHIAAKCPKKGGGGEAKSTEDLDKAMAE
jgi:hypothetical protein